MINNTQLENHSKQPHN